MVERCILQINNKVFSSSAAYILGLSPHVKIKGADAEIKVFSDVLESSRDVYKVLNGNATIELISEALASKSDKARVFESMFGQPWPF